MMLPEPLFTLRDFIIACFDRQRGLTPDDCAGLVKFYGMAWVEQRYAEGKLEESRVLSRTA